MHDLSQSLSALQSSRRRFLTWMGKSVAALGITNTIIGQSVYGQQLSQSSTSSMLPSKPPTTIKLPPIQANTEPGADAPVETFYPPDQRIGFAVVGLGDLALNEILPAFGSSKRAKLTALVSGSREKALEVARQYGVPEKAIYNYQNFDSIKDNPDVQVVYIVLPNSMHAEFTIRAAAAGKHVLTEKPMGISSKECEQMIEACRKADKKLMVAYRIQYEPYNKMMQKMVRDKTFGTVKMIEGVNGQNQDNPSQWRLNKALAGGGALPDVGLYCLNTFRYLLGEEPKEVFAQISTTPNDPRFKEVEETMNFQLRFPSGVIANCSTSYGFHQDRRYRVHASAGWFGLDPAFSYNGLQAETAHLVDKIEHKTKPTIPEKNQFALELDHMAECVAENKVPFTPGEEGLADQRIMEALYQSAKENRVISLNSQQSPAGKLDIYRGNPPA